MREHEPWVPGGVKRAHRKGITGKGITIGVKDNYTGGRYWVHDKWVDTISHGDLIETIIRSFAPDVNIIRNPNRTQAIEECDIISQSQGVVYLIHDYFEGFWNMYNLNRADIDVLRITAAGNYDMTTTDACSGNVNALETVYDYVDGELVERENNTGIIVGAITHDNKPEEYTIRAGITADHYLVARCSGPNPIAGRPWKRKRGGTSYSTPKVAAAAALLMQAYPELSKQQIKQAILEGASPFKGYEREDEGHGKLNINRSFKAARKIKREMRRR